MPSLREEITKKFLRFTGAAARRASASGPARAEYEETVLQPPSARHGQQIGVYRIIDRLGFGGMGHVYLALDTRLDRRVALKFLPPDLTSDSALLYRLEQEARTASALNHPNILTIYDIGEWEGDRFIASEYVEGVTLRQTMKQGALDAGTAIDIASQVASALMAAHSAGIVHRDLKPGNIMIRPDGYVKVIDFGLAKYVSESARNTAQPYRLPRSESPSEPITRLGSVIGTLTYMSPEQARGEELDQRTDIWSLGVILYEILARRLPFEGDTDTALVAAIQNDTPPPLAETKSLPPGLPRVIHRALAKDPRRRYQTAGELLADLQQVGPASGSKIRPVVVARSRTMPGAAIALAASLTLLLAAAVWWWPLGGQERLLSPDWFRVQSVRQLTYNGRTLLSAISPDGNYLAFVIGEPGGEQALYLKQVGSAAEEQKIAPRKISYEGLVFAPDSKSIFETEKDSTLTGKLYAIPLFGSRPDHPLIDDLDGPVTFSPDGNQFAFVRYLETQGAGAAKVHGALFVASADGSDPHPLVSIENLILSRRPAWSPHGDRIAAFLYSYSPGRGGEPLLDVIDLHGHESRRPSPQWQSVGQICWSPDARTLIVSATTRTQAKNQSQLRQLDVATGRTYDIVTDLATYSSATLTRDGLQLAAVKEQSNASLWISHGSDLSTGQTASAEAEDHPSLAWADENHVILNSNRSGFPNLWLFDVSAQTRTSLTNEPHVEQDAAPIPGGNSVVFSSNRDGYFHLWRFDPDTNRFTQLTFGPNYDDSPVVSPDGRWVVYTSWAVSDPHLFKVPVAGGRSVRLSSYSARSPRISPDGQFIACQFEDPATSDWAIGVLPFDGSAPPRPIPQAQLPVRWSPSGAALDTVHTDARGVSNIWSIPLDGSAPRQLTRFDADSILTFAWSPAGGSLACIRAAPGSDVALFKKQKNR